MRIRRLDMPAVAVVVGIGLLTECTHSRLSAKDIRPFYNSNMTHVEGLKSTVEKSRTVPVRVLVLHGMLTSGAGYSTTLQKHLVQRLGLNLVAQPAEHGEIVRGYDVTVFDGPQPLNSKVPIPPSQLTKTA